MKASFSKLYQQQKKQNVEYSEGIKHFGHENHS